MDRALSCIAVGSAELINTILFGGALQQRTHLISGLINLQATIVQYLYCITVPFCENTILIININDDDSNFVAIIIIRIPTLIIITVHVQNK